MTGTHYDSDDGNFGQRTQPVRFWLHVIGIYLLGLLAITVGFQTQIGDFLSSLLIRSRGGFNGHFKYYKRLLNSPAPTDQSNGALPQSVGCFWAQSAFRSEWIDSAFFQVSGSS